MTPRAGLLRNWGQKPARYTSAHATPEPAPKRRGRLRASSRRRRVAKPGKGGELAYEGIRSLLEERLRRGPRWFERFNPAAGAPRTATAAWLRALATAEVIFDNALYLWEETAELDVRPALDVYIATGSE